MVYTIVQLSRQHKYSVQARSQDIEKWRIITSITTKRKEDMKGRKSRHKKQDINGPRKTKKKKRSMLHEAVVSGEALALTFRFRLDDREVWTAR